MRIVVWIVLSFVLPSIANLDYLDNEVEHQCIQHCPLQNRTDAGHYDYACNYNCNIEQCEKGCKLWKRALKTNCRISCNGSSNRLTPREIYCVTSCNYALTKYFSQLRVQLGIPPPPALVADSLNSTSLKLEWNFPEAKRLGLDRRVQWRYEDLSSDWQYCSSSNITWDEQNNIVFVQSLQPYTKYRFRIAVILGNLGESIESLASVVISTLPSGIPQSPPIIVRAAPVDFSSISVTWEPGPFPHGPLLSYVLQITDNNPDGHSEVKDIPAEDNYAIARTLKPSTNYTISVSMRNNIGSGPPAKAVVTTPPEPNKQNAEQPVLILGSEHSVIQQGAHIADEPIILYNTSLFIRGIGIHVNKKLLFISDSSGYVLKMSLQANSQDKKYILSPKQSEFLPLDLTVDWLNNLLYILGEIRSQKKFIIKRCTLDGENLTVAYAGLRIKPSSMEIDPYNGFLFWTIHESNKAGLYRLDTSDISNGIKYEVKVDRILNETNLGAFIADHTNFRLLVSYEKQNTIKAVSLDGKGPTDLRSKVTNSKLQKVISLATANSKFYWTDGDDVFYEEYNHRYYHNSYLPLSARSYTKVFINLPSSQPTPVPINPPTGVQAIFGSNVAKIKWQPPHLLGVQGKGAWQNWSYEISIKDIRSNLIKTYKNISSTPFSVNGLQENTEYIIKAAAYTKSGKGPWSSEFKGLTLGRSVNPVILWSAAEGLLQSNAAGESVNTILHKSQMKNFHFTDITWFKDQIYLVTNDSFLYWYNLSSHKQGRLIDMDSVGSVAVDWIGMKLYWSNPKQQLIIRGNLNGTQQEPLPILTLAKELNIDSVKAYLYWSTGNGVECAHLNGVERNVYHHDQLFSGKQVMGLTLDMDKKFVYWIVRGSDGTNLFKSPMAGYFSNKPFTVEKVSTLQKSNMQGPLCYFHNRLLWLEDDRNAAIGDLNGKNIAIINSKSIWGLNMVYIVDSSLHILPDNKKDGDIIVIPEIINKTSVKVIGSANSFNITWKPVQNVNYGTVFYEVQIDSLSRNYSTAITPYPTIKYWQQVTPYTKLHIAIRAFTYWGTSPQIRTKIYSPPSTPSAPKNLRTYVVYEYQHASSLEENKYVSVTFRWDSPMFPNGILQGYKINCWFTEDDIEIDVVTNVIITAENSEYTINHLEDNKVYFFQVKAFTEIGDGTVSEPISVNTSHELPLPTLLIATADSIYIDDIDANHNISLVQSITTPIVLTYLMKENKVFWINQLQELLMYNLNTLNKSKIFDIQGNPNSLTIDWLERSLYYTELTDISTDIYKIDLNHMDKDIIKNTKVFSTNSTITKIEISPFTKKFYWIETNDSLKYKLMQSNIDGNDVQPFFSKQHIVNKREVIEEIDNVQTCNCSIDFEVEPTFTLDHSSTKNKPLLIFINSKTLDVISSDNEGCICNLIANNINKIKSLKSDFGTLYWTNPTQELLYAFKKREANLLTKEVNVNDVLIFGKHMQPYPPNECLSPKQHNNLLITLISKMSNSLTVSMPEFTVEDNCSEVSMATIQYTIFYMEENRNVSVCTFETCEKIITFDKIVVIDNLKPFTRYIVSVAVTNYFTDSREVLISSPAIFQTAPGAPSQPRNISAIILNPTLVEISWLPPFQLNGIIIHYEIHVQTDGPLSSVRQPREPVVEKHHPDASTYFTTLLHKLSPNETYTVWIRAYSESKDSSSDSEKIEITTFPEPSNLTLVNKTAYALKISWLIPLNIVKYFVEYAPLTSKEWVVVEQVDENEDELIVEVTDLKPKTMYKFRVSLFYEKYPELYIWPTDSRFTFETLGDRPSPPETPIIQYVKPKVYKVWWEASKDNGAPIEMYMLEGLKLFNYREKRSTNRSAWFYSAPSIEEEEQEWQSLYNGTNTSWIIEGLSEKYKYTFRVSALNTYGWSEPSNESPEFDFYEAARRAEKQNPMVLIPIAIAVPISVLIMICVFYAICTKKCKKQKKLQQTMPISRRGPDVELATLRELPRRGVHSTNILYVSTQPTPEDLTLLPHIRRDNITLTKFLGSGAFGEVFEGKAKGIFGSNEETKVAIKTLRKGAPDQEKTEFLQEAQLMSHFKHEHILQLLGVCLDNDPHFIIMELMQGGDLLTYLRSSRTPLTNTPPLNLIELLKMCVDVSKGCRYLEEMHFVHRDLACRNCLVSSIETDTRIVKIGDFGLARDIYKNDYYRKEGEGLLPVRWMSPESLVDGVFTSQSDVWAFGVLLWEIMTLGQQPYPARNNLEVLHYVRGGGRLGKPTDCPKDLHNLMLLCWEFKPEKRPTFKYCLEVLQNLHRQKLRSPVTGAHEGQYISTVTEEFEGISNAIYFQKFRDENHNSSGASWKSEPDEDTAAKEKVPFLNEQTVAAPKYLELVYEPESETTIDGYEIPSIVLQRKNSDTSTIRSSLCSSINSDNKRN